MSPRTTILLAVVAGFTGGIVSQHVIPASVYAQSPAPVATEIRAEMFVVVDHDGVPRGAFGMDKKNEWATVQVTDTKGEVESARYVGIWRGKRNSIIPPQ